jgi:hypothetical protein
MNYLEKVIRTMMLLLLVKLWLLVLVLVAMMLTPPTPLSHLLWSLLCPLWPQLLVSSTRASQTMRLPCWWGSSEPCTSSIRRGRDHLGAALSVMTPLTSSPTTLRGRSSTPPTSTTTSTETTPATRATIRRSTALGTRRKRRSFRRSCPERVLPWMTLTSPVITPPAHRRMRRSSVSKATSLAFASWASLHDTSLTLTLI